MLCSLLKNRSQKTLLGILMFCLLGVGQGFAMDSWIDHMSTKTPGKTGDCYQIKSAGDLAWYANFVNKQGQHAESCAELQSDIDLSGNFWVPISYKGVRHKVNFNGNGFIINNLYINAEYLLDKYPPPATGDHAAQNLGLIGAFEGHVQNVILENVEIYGYGRNFATAGKDPIKNPLSIGTVVGWQTTDTSVVENCYVTGKMVTSGDGQAVGGIVGNNGGGTIRNCYSAVNIDASGVAYVGGIAGYTKAYESGTVTISSCVYNGENLSSTGSGGAGAIVGNHLDGSTTFENVYYDTTKFNNGVGTSMGGSISGSPSGTDNLNSELIASTLNEGSEDNPWSSGESDVCLNGYGADGHKVTFDANGGSFAGGTTYVKYVQHGNIINNDGVADPTWANDNFVFAGWLGDDYNKAATKATTITASWNPVYTITFDAAPGTFPNEASGVVKTVKVESGKKIAVKDFVVPSFYTNQGVKYSFMGWSTNKTPKEEDALVDENGLDDLPIATDNITLYAVWTEATIYTVTFDANGHGPSIANYVKVKNVYDQEKATALTDDDFEHADGYSLDTESGSGWCIDSECSEEFDFNTPIEENKTLYAKWKAKEYTIAYENLNGASNSNPSKYTVDGLVLADPSWDAAHRFLGWYKDSEFKNKVTNIPAGSTGNLTLYAKWEDVTYTITYRGGAYGIGLVPSETKIHGQSYTLRDTSYTRKGYTQTGWATDTNGAKVYEFGASYEDDAPLTVYPTWDTAHYVVEYECNDCENNPLNPTTYTMFEKKDLPLKYPQNLDGYKFGGWFKENTYETKTTQIKKGSVGDLTLYGKWNKIYKITYVGTDKSYCDSVYTVDDTITLRNPADSAGYTFGGWYDNAGFDGVAVTGIANGSTGDTTFYAKWTPEAFPIVYHNIEGATFEKQNPETYTVEDGNIDLYEPSMAGYNFLGWFISEEAEEPVAGIAAGSTGEAHFYARWEKVYPFLVGDYGAVKVFENADGSTTAQINTNSSETVEIPSDISVNHVEFIRKFTVGKNSTIMLPFSIDTTKISGGSFKEFAYVDETVPKAVFYNDVAGGVIQANTPYIFVPTSDTLIIDIADGDSVVLNTNNVTVPVSEKDGGKWQFRGVYSRIDWPSGDKQAWGFVANTSSEVEKIGKFKRAGSGAYIVPLRGYLYNTQAEEQTSVQQSARRFLAKATYGSTQTASISNSSGPNSMEVDFVEREVEVEIEPEVEKTTVISKVNAVSAEIRAINGWFDMRGRKLNAKPTTKGIYYFNGKQVIVR